MDPEDFEIGADGDDPLALLGVSGEDYADVGDEDDDVEGEDYADVGDEDDDVEGTYDVGARKRKRSASALRARQARALKKSRVAQRNQAAAAAASAKQARKARQMNRLQAFAKAGRLPQLALPVDSGATVAAGNTLDVQPQPTRPLRITDFIVSPDIAASFRINRLEIAGVNLWAGGGAIDASCFVPTVTRPPLQSVILHAGVPAVVNVTNKSGAAARFTAVLYGIPVHAI